MVDVHDSNGHSTYYREQKSRHADSEFCECVCDVVTRSFEYCCSTFLDPDFLFILALFDPPPPPMPQILKAHVGDDVQSPTS